MMKRIVFCVTLIVSGFMGMAQNPTGMKPEAFVPFNVGEIRPEGWLHDWCGMASRGLTKTIGEEFTEFVDGWKSSDKPGWWHYEQSGYYIDGVTRLGFIMNDTLLMNRSKSVMEAVINRQRADGYIFSDNKECSEKWGSADADYGMYWSEAVFCRAALAYYSATNDMATLAMLENVYDGFPIFERSNPGKPMSGFEMDNLRKIVGVENMMEISRYSGNSAFANRANQVIEKQKDAFVNAWVNEKQFLRTGLCHGVTYNETAKLLAVASIWNGDADCLAASANAFEFLQNHFVLPSGVNSSNEYLHGIGAFESGEVCDISDFIWSNIWLARATGDARYGDRIEKAFFNALPTAVNAYFDLSVYTTAMNRIPGIHYKARDDGQYFKMLHWPTCCSANLNRALPNFIINMFMHNAKGELMALTYGPAHLQSRDGSYDIMEETHYPFRDSIKLTINALPKGETLLLRVPQWCESASCSINGKTIESKAENGFFRLTRKWKSGDVVVLVFPMKPQLETGREQFADYYGVQPYWGGIYPNTDTTQFSGFADGADYAVVNYGPLVCALCLKQSDSHYFALNEELWHEFRYALDDKSLQNSIVTFNDFKPYFKWAKEDAPFAISVKADLIDWNPDKGDPKLPVNPPKILQRNVSLDLIPMGCAPYRLSMFGLVK